MSYSGSVPPWRQEENQETEIETNTNSIQELKTNVSSLQTQVDNLSTATMGGGYNVNQHLDTMSDVTFHSVNITGTDTLSTGINHLIISPNRGVSSNDFISISNEGTVSLRDVNGKISDLKTQVSTTKIRFDNGSSVEGMGNIMSIVAPKTVLSGGLEIGGDIKTLQYSSVDGTLDDFHQDISVLQTDLADIKNHHQPNQITSTGDCKFHSVKLYDPASSAYYDLDGLVKHNESDIILLKNKVDGLDITNGVLTVNSLFTDDLSLTGYGQGGPYNLRSRIQYLMDKQINNDSMVEMKAARIHTDQLYVKDSSNFEYNLNNEIETIKANAGMTNTHHSINNIFTQSVLKDDGSSLHLIEALSVDGIHLLWQKRFGVVSPVFVFDTSLQWYFSYQIHDYHNLTSHVNQFTHVVTPNSQTFLNHNDPTTAPVINQDYPVKISLFLTSSSDAVYRSYQIGYFVGINVVTVKCERLANTSTL